MLPIGILGAVQFLPAQPPVARTVQEAAVAEEDATVELTAAERRAQRKAEREASEVKTETVAVEPEPEVTVEVVNPGFNGFDMQNADFGTMQTPFAGGFGMMPMPPFGGFPGFGAVPTTDENGFPGFGAMPQTNAEGFPDFGATPNADGNYYDAFGAAFGNF